MTILVTGCAGFIGAALARRLSARGDEVTGVDNLNDYYDPNLKQARLALLAGFENFTFRKLDVSDGAAVRALFHELRPERALHLAAQAGVRYSLTHPQAYVDANVTGFLNVLEGCRATGVEHLVYASSSSVYGDNEKLPFSETDRASSPASLYGATKLANELMAYSYARLYGVPATGLRYFTVYGPWGRPDMSPTLFAEKIFAGEPLQVFNRGEHQRDFTYIDDAVEATLLIADDPPSGTARHASASAGAAPAPHRVYNVGNQRAIKLMDFIGMLESGIGKRAIIRFAPRQAGDVTSTLSDSSGLLRDFNFVPRTPPRQGIKQFLDWYKRYYEAV